MTKPKTKCVLYARFSPRPDAALADCQSIGIQLAACRAYAERKGYIVVDSYSDEGKSRNDSDRLGLHTAIKRMFRGWVLVAYSTDRLGAGTAAVLFEHDVVGKGGRIEYATGDVNGESADKRLVRGILREIDDHQRAKIGEKTSAGMLYRQANGERMSHKAPMGKMPDPDDPRRWVDNPEEQRAMRTIRRWRREGVIVAEIVRRLNDPKRQPVYTPRGIQWHRETVKRILARGADSD